MRIATWNLEWPPTTRQQSARAHLEKLGADILVTTEDCARPWTAYPHAVDGGNDWGYRTKPDRRKVVIWSHIPLTNLDIDTPGATQGRLVAVSIDLHPTCTVVGVCIPWASAHVSTGRGDQRRWGEHLEFCEVLRTVLAELRRTGPVIVAGDFNQRLPRRQQPEKVWEALQAAFEGFHVGTSEDLSGIDLIDHIACSRDLTISQRGAWSNVIEEARLSDHAGVWADIELMHH